MNAAAAHILLIEDEKHIRRFLRISLEAAGMRVSEAETGREGMECIGLRRPDLVVLDLGLPDTDGIQVIRQLRTWAAFPIVVLSARSEEMQKVHALDAGADDYLTKPFGAPELLARIRAHLRKRPLKDAQAPEPIVRFGDVTADFLRRQVTRNGEPVHLTPIEYRLLATLVRNAGKVLTHAYLLREVWGPGNSERSHYLRIYMGHLRQKLEDDPARPAYILTETGIGYRLVFE
ncbi:two-component system response regulator KdpE [Noviherbaspirillum sp.]|uniref:two-component system response regulator KdpE n=1 Tax=Noviherbaspirillum sp. TaxID=1926288 RepID=UPI002FE27890